MSATNDDSWIDALRAPDGERLLQELASEDLDAGHELSVITRLRARYDAALVAAAVTQAKLRIRARGKFSRADRMLFTAAGLEQASSERMARLHASRFEPFDRMADLCSGIGGDLLGLAAARQVVAVDRDRAHSRLGVINAAANDLADHVSAVRADVRDFELGELLAAFIDPARRTEDRRLAPGASEPSLDWCFALAARGIALGVKASPALPLELVPPDWEIEFVSERRELKEAVLWSPVLARSRRRATVLPSGESFAGSLDVRLPLHEPGAFLIDPDPTVTRGGLVEALGAELGDCWKIDDQVAFLSADSPLLTPFGRTLQVDASMPWSLKRLNEALRSLDVGSVDIRKRGSAVDVEQIQRRLKLNGTRPATVVLTRVANVPWAFVCRAIDREGARVGGARSGGRTDRT